MSNLRMWIVEVDQNEITDCKFYIDDPIHIPRIGEFVDGHFAAGWVQHIQWNFVASTERNQSTAINKANYQTVYVYLNQKKNA